MSRYSPRQAPQIAKRKKLKKQLAAAKSRGWDPAVLKEIETRIEKIDDAIEAAKITARAKKLNSHLRKKASIRKVVKC